MPDLKLGSPAELGRNILKHTSRVPVDRSFDSYISRSAEIEDPSSSRLARCAIWLVGLACVAFLVWASFTPLHELTIARGSIVPVGFIQEIEHLEGGIVADVFIDDGQLVEQGDALIKLDEGKVRAELHQAETQLESLRLSAERLTAFSERRDAVIVTKGGRLEIVNSQLASGENRSKLRRARIAMIDASIAARQSEVEGTRAQIEATATEYDIMSKRSATYLEVAERGFVSQREVESVLREKLKIGAELARLKGQLSSLQSSIEEARARREEADAELSTEALEELTRIETEKEQMTALVRQLRDQLKRTTVRAPIAGRIHSLSVRGNGEVVDPGEVIATIVPDGAPVFAQVEINAEDIGFVRPGMPAVLKVTAYDFARFGGVEGVVDRVSPGHRVTNDERIVFDARIALNSTTVGPASAERIVTPGMTVVADIRSGRKTALDYLLKPLNAISDRALTEK